MYRMVHSLVAPKPPQGPLVHLGSMPLSMRRTLTRESQSQKALEPDGE